MTGIIVSQLNRILAEHGLNLLRQDCYAELANRGHADAAISLLDARIEAADTGIVRFVWSNQQATRACRRACLVLSEIADRHGLVAIHLSWTCGSDSYEITATYHRTVGSTLGGSGGRESEQRSASPGRFNVPQLDRNADFATVQTFINDCQRQGLIVTVMTHFGKYARRSDKFIFANDQQAKQRQGGWEIDDWIGANALATVWLHSFKSGEHNYYEELYDRLDRDGSIDQWRYQILRPDGSLFWDITSYRQIDNYGGTAEKPVPARIAISGTSPQDSQLIYTAQELHDCKRNAR